MAVRISGRILLSFMNRTSSVMAGGKCSGIDADPRVKLEFAPPLLRPPILRRDIVRNLIQERAGDARLSGHAGSLQHSKLEGHAAVLRLRRPIMAS